MARSGVIPRRDVKGLQLRCPRPLVVEMDVSADYRSRIEQRSPA